VGFVNFVVVSYFMFVLYDFECVFCCIVIGDIFVEVVVEDDLVVVFCDLEF